MKKDKLKAGDVLKRETDELLRVTDTLTKSKLDLKKAESTLQSDINTLQETENRIKKLESEVQMAKDSRVGISKTISASREKVSAAANEVNKIEKLQAKEKAGLDNAKKSFSSIPSS